MGISVAIFESRYISQRSRGLQNEVEVGTRRALRVRVILVTWTATPWKGEGEKSSRERCRVVRILPRADVNEPRSCHIPVCHHRDFLPFSLPSSPNVLLMFWSCKEEEFYIKLRSNFKSARNTLVRHNFHCADAILNEQKNINEIYHWNLFPDLYNL